MRPRSISLKDRLADGVPLLGTFCGLGSIDAVELACHAGFDLVVIDAQHGDFDVPSMRHALRAVEAAGGCAVARLPADGLSSAEALLDAGYSALIVPMVNGVAQARRAVQAVYYPPMGERSQSSCRASLRVGEGYRKCANDGVLLLAMIESADAVEACEPILAEPGIGGCFIGPTDLRSSLSGQHHKDGTWFDSAIERVRRAAAIAGKVSGIAAHDGVMARRRAEAGFGFVIQGGDRRSLSEAMTKQVAVWKQGGGVGG